MFRIKNWLKYQHYGEKKTVPWIKLHYEVLTGEDFSDWDNDAKLLAIVCMLIASRHNGDVPNNPKHVQRLGNLDKLPDFKPLIKTGFLESIEDLNESRQSETLESESLSLSNSLSREGGMGGKRRNIYSDEFLEFWSVYPPNDGPKSTAYKSFIKAAKEIEHETIIERAGQYANHCSQTGTYIAHAATWLNQRRWEVDYSIKIISPGNSHKQRKGGFDDVLGVLAGIAAREIST